ncbi:MAG TPA: hypothetical protein VFO10_01630 [Oligoflexus sp.]|uniref:hypothetical protein n=1 Tax=Oligoflexus sp. TaxID=1971216 RepID=UPI002D7E80C6|nr:hypothetical protein [Oligoflexus sp.]HET9235917.1 hypothetical protein [Oligoflexus sp.]
MMEKILKRLHPKFDGADIENIRVSTDPVVREMILWEYGLEPLLPHALDLTQVRDEVREFARLHGTLFAIRTALGWVGFPNAKFVRLNSRDYEVDPGRAPTDQEINAIRAALDVSVQPRGKLIRIFNGAFEVRYG